MAITNVVDQAQGLINQGANFLGINRTSRNFLFRERPVTVSLERFDVAQHQWVPDTNSPFVLLREVTSVKEGFGGTSGVSKGAVAAVVQGWYLSPITVEITGRSYVGSFSDQKFNKLNTDTDMERLFVFRDRINAAFINPVVSGQQRVAIRFGRLDPSAPSNRALSQSLVGFIDDIKMDDSDSMPYMRPYVIRFTGEFRDAVDVSTGSQAQNRDAAIPQQVVGRAP